MTNLSDLSIGQLNRIIAIKEQIAKLEGELESVAGNGDISISTAEAAPKKRRMSAAWRAKIAAAARARWAKVKGTRATPKPAKKADKRMSPAVKAKLAAIAKARWAKAKAAGKSTL